MKVEQVIDSFDYTVSTNVDPDVLSEQELNRAISDVAKDLASTLELADTAKGAALRIEAVMPQLSEPRQKIAKRLVAALRR